MGQSGHQQLAIDIWITHQEHRTIGVRALARHLMSQF